MGLPQCFDGTPRTVQGGTLAPIKFHHPDLANSTALVLVTYEDGTTSQIEITLDSSGKGTANYLVPDNGDQALLLSHPLSRDFDILVLG